MYAAAVRAVDPCAATTRALQRQGDTLRVADTTIDLTTVGNIFVVGFGKAAAVMAQGVESVLGDRITAGLVVTKYGHALPTQTIRVLEAAHPTPDAASVDASARIVAMIDDCAAADLVICLVSGGGSAVFEQPVAGITLEDMQETTQQLLHAGAPITALNTVRKHLSAVKGGQLARRAAPATLVALLLSDVVGDALDVIASGPTVPDSTTFADAIAVLRQYGVHGTIPAPARDYLAAGARGERLETPKPGDPIFETTHTKVIANGQAALDAAARVSEAMGLRTLILSSSLEGEARDVARMWSSVALQVRRYAQPLSPPCCILAGGETTVTVKGDGIGGRNSEFALAAACLIGDARGIVVASLATDGGDGPTDAAGAVATSATLALARGHGRDAARMLARNDAHTFFAAVGGLVRPGPTGTNVNDLMIALIE